MAHVSIRWTDELDEGFVLAPERYDPRITQKHYLGDAQSGRTLAQLVDLSKDVVTLEKADPEEKYMVLDTGDAKNGIICRKSVTNYAGIGSTKKVLHIGDVIISRLRPYLRQIGFVDSDLASASSIVASTEFYVLRPKDGSSIAYLVPFLLSSRIQEVLCASQEGGHHPRVPEKTLLNLVIPQALLNRGVELSQHVEKATRATRLSERTLLQALNDTETMVL
jgi:hypothetical protein